ncbi:MAG: hypothetical protein CL693_05240 [Cellvibrionaceae bacterium]|nr:hypothetical protein [Cellvibrionaceae bacterium]|tara:strand:+ start:4069 stop:4491 length:423 start_codon:yes stop_codon:yes gene_type:complete
MFALPLDVLPYLCIFLLILLCFILAIAVTIARGRLNILAGAPEDPDSSFYQLVRAHGNQIEFVPLLALLMYMLAQSPQPVWVLWCMVLVTGCRYLLAVGMIVPKTLAQPNPLRFIGAVGTYVLGLALCWALLAPYLSGLL